ncbi:hypothetical protein [Pseudomonas sp. PS02303]|uniref:hypothetical protein n=1 Tax=Pseudomonas sp. PS02303 TaxID=2991429 RepID=UPI00249CDFDD|nr:hypothetical protein [Pseudomonas sp. PS02303]
MSKDKMATCHYKYVLEGKEKAGKTEVSEELKHPGSAHDLSEALRRSIRLDEPKYFIKTPEEHGATRTGYLVGPAMIVFGWDKEFERGFESGVTDRFNFYVKDRPLKL